MNFIDITSGGKLVASFISGKVYLNTKNKTILDDIKCEIVNKNLLRVGGRIFYDNGSNGATYNFYDESYNWIQSPTINNLANAYYYTVSGNPTKDRWYVCDNTSHTTGGKTVVNGLVQSNIYWGYTNVVTGASDNLIGSGKTNTNKALAVSDTSSYSDSIFKYVKACRDSNLNGCNDWFIPCCSECDVLINSRLIYIYDAIWSSVEDNAGDGAWYWNYVTERWANGGKNVGASTLAIRAF